MYKQESTNSTLSASEQTCNQKYFAVLQERQNMAYAVI